MEEGEEVGNVVGAGEVVVDVEAEGAAAGEDGGGQPGPAAAFDALLEAGLCTAWGEGAGRFLELLRAGPVPAGRLHLVSPAETVAELARRGSHAGLLTRSTVEGDLATGRLVELPVADLPRWEFQLSLAYRTEDAGTPPVRAVRAALLR